MCPAFPDSLQRALNIYCFTVWPNDKVGRDFTRRFRRKGAPLIAPFLKERLGELVKLCCCPCRKRSAVSRERTFESAPDRLEDETCLLERITGGNTGRCIDSGIYASLDADIRT